MFDVIKNKYWFIGFSSLTVIAAVIMIALYGFRPGVDFSGGTLWQFSIADSSVTTSQLNDHLKNQLHLENFIVTQSDTGFLVRTNELTEAKHQEYLDSLSTSFKGVEELRFESIGPTVGRELRSKAITAFLMVLFGISLYVAFAFRKVSYPVSSWKYGVVTLVTLFHDAILPAGLYAWLGHRLGLEVDINFIVAILVVIGFSVHDTIVVFDRIRENLLTQKNKDLETLINESIHQTMARSINTSLTLVLVLLALYLFGAANLHYFILTILVGTVFGTYSSIFLASPSLTLLQRKK